MNQKGMENIQTLQKSKSEKSKDDFIKKAKKEYNEILKELIIRKSPEIYKKNPLLWLKDRFGEDPKTIKWSDYEVYKGHTWDGDKDPFLQAFQALANRKWVGIESATSTGKTFWLARVVFWFLDCFDNALVVTCAPKQDQLKLHLWSEISRAFDKFKAIRPYAHLYSLRIQVDERPENPFRESHQAVGFVSGVGSSEESATKAQGFHRENMLIITEETPGINGAVMTAFENTSTAGNNLILAVGNPDNESDELHQFCFPNFKPSEKIKHIRISSLDHPNILLQKELIKGAITQESIDLRKTKYGEDSNFYKSRVRGISPSQSVDSLIKLEWIEKCLLSEHEYIAEAYNSLGIDVANSETGDKACTAFMNGNVLVEIQEFQCPNATHLAYNVVYDDLTLEEKGYTNYHTSKLSSYQILDNYIGIDTVGVGKATFNAFLDLGMNPIALEGGVLQEALPKDENGKPLYSFSSGRAQWYWQLREDLRLGIIKISIKDKTVLRQLIRELVAPKYSLKEGKLIIESKESIKKRLGGKSPNLADAFVYANWMSKGHYAGVGDLPFYVG